VNGISVYYEVISNSLFPSRVTARFYEPGNNQAKAMACVSSAYCGVRQVLLRRSADLPQNIILCASCW